MVHKGNLHQTPLHPGTLHILDTAMHLFAPKLPLLLQLPILSEMMASEFRE